MQEGGKENTEKKICCHQSHGGFCLTCPRLIKQVKNAQKKIVDNMTLNHEEIKRNSNTNREYEENQDLFECCGS